MPRNQDPILPDDEGFDPDLEPDDDDLDTGEDVEDPERQVAHRPDPAPNREEEEEELAEADIMERLDVDDLKQMEGPDA